MVVELFDAGRQTNAARDDQNVHVCPHKRAIILKYFDEKSHDAAVIANHRIQLWPGLFEIAFQARSIGALLCTENARHYCHRMLNLEKQIFIKYTTLYNIINVSIGNRRLQSYYLLNKLTVVRIV